ncbi:MAG TPA: UDP-glucose/GDP-mannose dehydrogenase family protein [Verrucomicrobiae bacterium]|nr:UDP-glucose/GDP-mannose dehydrogenase family protein [Verrucomicrobiae bacterium]
MRVTVVGTGYVGLVTGACLARLGHDVTCVDNAPERVAAVNSGRAPFFEPGLEEILTGAIRDGRLRASSNTAAAVASSQISMLAVGTPSRQGEIDLSYLSSAAEEIGKGLRDGSQYRVVVVKSTVVPGTADTLVRGILERVTGRITGEFGLAMNPEFLREGSAVADFLEPDRIVVGEWDLASGRAVAELYQSFECPKIFTTLRNAEMTKYASNALLATLVSFANEFAALCEATPGTDVEQVLNGLFLDRRLSPIRDGSRITPGILAYLRAGCGFGGSCLPKDVAALRHFARGQGVGSPLLDGVAAVNARRPAQLAALVEGAIGSLHGAAIAVLGLAFKPGTDDLRDSPALAIIRELEHRGAEVRAYDPMISAVAGLTVRHSAFEAVSGADAAIVATAWPEFAELDWATLSKAMRRPILVDGRNALRHAAIPDDMTLISIGIGPEHVKEPEGATLVH